MSVVLISTQPFPRYPARTVSGLSRAISAPRAKSTHERPCLLSARVRPIVAGRADGRKEGRTNAQIRRAPLPCIAQTSARGAWPASARAPAPRRFPT